MHEPALHRLHSVTCAFRPPIGSESGEAALREIVRESCHPRLFDDF